MYDNGSYVVGAGDEATRAFCAARARTKTAKPRHTPHRAYAAC